MRGKRTPENIVAVNTVLFRIGHTINKTYALSYENYVE
jgi:hypothetical protein